MDRKSVIRGSSKGIRGGDSGKVYVHALGQTEREGREAVFEVVAVYRVLRERAPVLPQEHADQHALLV